MKHLGKLRTVTVISNAAKLALTKLATGTEATVTFGGFGAATYRYLGGGESTEANWLLVSPIRVYENGGDNRTNNTTLSDAVNGFAAIDFIPVGVYALEMTIEFFTAGAGGSKCQFVSSGALDVNTRIDFTANSFAYGPVSYFYAGNANGLPATGGTDCQVYRGIIHILTAGDFRLQWAQNSMDSTATTLMTGHMILTPIM